MDQNEEHIHKFESILKNQTTKKSSRLYCGREDHETLLNKPRTARARDVLESVSKQIQAIQNADTASYKKVGRKLDKYKRRGFLPVDMLTVEEEVPTVKPNNFDTQFVSNTQLINIIENAEIIDRHRGVTQEFDNTFCQRSDDSNEEIIVNNGIDENIDREQKIYNVETDSNSVKVIQESQKQLEISSCNINVTSEMDTLTCLPNVNYDCDDVTVVKKCQNDSTRQVTNDCFVLVNKVKETSDEIQDVHVPTSPVFNTRRTATPPMVFSLYAFEKFENLALPIIEEYPDLKTAKNLINSQIIEKELFIPNHITSSDVQIPITNEVECVTKNIKDIERLKSVVDSEVIPNNSPECSINKSTKLDNITLNVAVKSEFEDELLFSSDEEDDYAHKDIQELPLTCALETSFYDKSDVLDKTMYVGFQTASNKSIQISIDSFSKAKSMLSDTDSDKTSIKELVEIFDSGKERSSNLHLISELTGDNKHHNIKDESSSKIKSTENLEQVSELRIQSGEKNDYTSKNTCLTALEQGVLENNDIIMSQVIEFKSVPSMILKEKNKALKSRKRKSESIKSTSNKIMKLSDKALAQCKKVFKNIDSKENYEPVPCYPDLKESKEIAVKIEDEAASINLSQDIFEISDNSDTEDKVSTAKSKKEDTVISQINDIIILKEFEDNDMDFQETNNNGFMGFKTASNKDIVISEGALVRTKGVFHDILVVNEDIDSKTLNIFPCNNIENDIVFEKSDLGLKTAKMNVNESREPSTLSKNEDNLYIPPSTGRFIGFKTASNKDINISRKTMEQMKNFYKDVDDEFKTSVNKEKQVITQQVLEDDLDTENMVAEELPLNEETSVPNSGVENKNSDIPVFVRFQTASKKNISVSEKALAESKKLFEDITVNDKNEQVTIENITPRIFEKPKNYKVKNSNTKNNNSNANEKILLDKASTKEGVLKHKTEAPIFVGFQTASDKKVKISDEALARSKKLFQDIALSQSNNARIDGFMTCDRESVELEKTEEFIEFKTAALKPVKISTEPLAKSGQTLKKFVHDNVGNVMYSNDRCNRFPEPTSFNVIGFRTASNKNVQVSAEALVKSKELLSEFEFNGLDKMVENCMDSKVISDFVGFQTASNKNIRISAEALATSKRLLSEFELKDVDNTEESDDIIPASSNFVGFHTASNKEVHVSKDALVKSKEILKDIELKNESDQINNDKVIPSTSSKFVGFHTASNKKINISEDALVKSKQIFCDIDDHEIESTKQKEETSTVFKGFQTASNKNVVISEKALKNSKKLFQDIEIESGKESNTIVERDNAKLFKGFQTASNKKVVISEKALVKSKKLFEDIEISQLSKSEQSEEAIVIINKELNETHETMLNNAVDINTNMDMKSFKGFHTASNRKVVISEQDLAKTKVLWKEESFINPKNDSIIANRNGFTETESNKDNLIRDIIDTQVLNDFQDALNTEDFCKSTPKSKRSGSPILSCPRAKKRRFETPYKSEKNTKVVPENTFVPPKLANTYKFKDNYKKDKKYTLRDLRELNKDAKIEIKQYVSKFNFDTLTDFEFFDARNDYTAGKIDVNQLKKVFLDAVNKKIVPDGWLENHIQLIIWKLLSYEITFPNSMKNVCTVTNVLEQLKYRYDKELFNVERSILRKILEKDDVPSKTMVLCVAGIYVDNESVASVPNISRNIELLLTDGWYSVRACLDRLLTRLVCSKAIVVGCKLATSGAELLGCEQGKAPWEDLSSVRLKLSGNSTRRARWHSALGAAGGLVRCGVRGARAEGGRAALTALVARVYPPLYAEKREGNTVTLSERLEHVRQAMFETERQSVMEKIYEELERELADQESQDSEGYSNENTNCPESGSQISKLMKKSLDPDEYKAQLTATQNQMLEEHNARRRERKIEEIRAKFQDKLDQSGLNTERNVVPLLKVRLADFKESQCGVEVTTGYLSIWKPSAAVVDIVKEGAWIEIINVLPTGVRNSEIQVSAGRQTIFREFKPKNIKFQLHTDIIKRKCYNIKELAENPSMSSYFNEIDTTGMVFLIEPPTRDFDEKKNNFQNVFLADADKNMICVNFWGGIKKFGFEYVIDTGQILTCVNLQKRAGNTRKSVPQYRATEFTCFTKTPKDKHAAELTKELEEKLTKIKEKFCEDCVALKNNYTIFQTRNCENVSPYRVDGKSVVSPLLCDANLNLTGLDFESSFKDPEISPMAALRKKQINKKIKKLRMYGEPPPLSNIHIINKSKNASADYKSPLLVKSSVTNLENQIETVTSVEKRVWLQNSTSPVSLNRTYVKKINPVKLNFSDRVAIENDLNDSVDHFAEEFESSPPLSLDSDVLL